MQRTQVKLPTVYGDLQMSVWPGQKGLEPAAVYTKIDPTVPVLVRIHSECLTGDVFGSLRCDCQEQLHESLREIIASKNGVCIYLRQEGRGIGLYEKAKAYALQEKGHDTYSANNMLGHPDDAREYNLALMILEQLKIDKVKLMTNNPEKIRALRSAGLSVQQVPMITKPHEHNRDYLLAKGERENTGQMKPFDSEGYKQARGTYNQDCERYLITQLQETKFDSLLDVGCGDGVFTRQIQEVFLGSTVLGIDSSQTQIDYAEKLPTKASFQIQDIAEYVSSEKYDVAISLYAFPHIPKSKLKKSLQNIKRSTRKGGTFYLYTNIADFDLGSVSLEEQEACDVNFINNWSSQINLTTLSEMRDLFKEVGFKEVGNCRRNKSVAIKNYGDVYSWSFSLQAT